MKFQLHHLTAHKWVVPAISKTGFHELKVDYFTHSMNFFKKDHSTRAEKNVDHYPSISEQKAGRGHHSDCTLHSFISQAIQIHRHSS